MKQKTIELNVWGGLAGQLAGLAYAKFLRENFPQKIKLLFHNGGNEKRPLVIAELVSLAGFDFKEINDYAKSSFIKNLINLKYKLIRFIKKFFLKINYMENTEILNSHLATISNKNYTINGYYTDWDVIFSSVNWLNNILSLTEIPNFLNPTNSYSGTAIHLRRGDYVTASNANKFHGIVDPSKVTQLIYENEAMREREKVIFSDSPEMIRTELQKMNKINSFKISKSSSIWDEMHQMCSFDFFIGSNSAISMWVALSYKFRKLDFATRVFMPKYWTKANDLSGSTENYINDNFITYEPGY